MLASARRAHNAKAARNATIFRRAAAGDSLMMLAAHYGISKQRVAQVVRAEALRRGRPVIGGLARLRAAQGAGRE